VKTLSISGCRAIKRKHLISALAIDDDALQMPSIG